MFEIAADYAKFNTEFEVIGGYFSPVSDVSAYLYIPSRFCPSLAHLSYLLLAYTQIGNLENNVGAGSKYLLTLMCRHTPKLVLHPQRIGNYHIVFIYRFRLTVGRLRMCELAGTSNPSFEPRNIY